MATIILSNPVFYNNGTSGASAAVGYANGVNRNVRYTLIPPATGANHVDLTFTGSPADNTNPTLRFYIGTSPTSHTNAGSGAAYTGTLSRQSNGTYTGSADIILTPGTTYYVWVFPSTATYGWANWNRGTEAARAVTSGAALSEVAPAAPITLGETVTLNVTRYGDDLTHIITYAAGTASGTICDKSAVTAISWNAPLELACQNTVGTLVSITFTITTYNGTTALGSKTHTCAATIPESVAPSVKMNLSDATGSANTHGGYIQGISKLNVVLTPTLACESEIAAYKTTVNGATYTAASFTTGVLTSGGEIVVSVTVTDKRGRIGTANQTITVQKYAPPVIHSLTVHRCNADGTTNDQGEAVRVNFTATVTGLSGLNSAAYTLQYKKTTDAEYTTIDLADYADHFEVTDGQDVFTAVSGSSYMVRLTVTDDFGNITKNTSVSTAFVIMHWMARGLGMAIGKIAELAGVLDIAFKTRFHGGILHPVLSNETDVDSVLTPNTYVGTGESGRFILEVMGAEQIKHRMTFCDTGRTLERFHDGTEWGEWVCTSDFTGTLLWSGGWFMQDTQTITLPEPISKQKTGIVLVFSKYESGKQQNDNFSTHFVPKMQVATHPGCGHVFLMTLDSTLSAMGAKYLVINDTTISGNANNNTSGTGCGITYNNGKFVLRHIIGV